MEPGGEVGHVFSKALHLSHHFLLLEEGRANPRTWQKEWKHSSLRIDGSPAIDVRSTRVPCGSPPTSSTSPPFSLNMPSDSGSTTSSSTQHMGPGLTGATTTNSGRARSNPVQRGSACLVVSSSSRSLRFDGEERPIRKDREKLTLSSLAMAYSVVNESSVSLISSYLVSISNSKKKRTKLTSSSLPSFLSRSRMRRRQTSLLRLPQITQSSSRIAPSGCS